MRLQFSEHTAVDVCVGSFVSGAVAPSQVVVSGVAAVCLDVGACEVDDDCSAVVSPLCVGMALPARVTTFRLGGCTGLVEKRLVRSVEVQSFAAVGSAPVVPLSDCVSDYVDVVGTVAVAFAVAGMSAVVDGYVSAAVVAGPVHGDGVGSVGGRDRGGLVIAGVAVV